MPIRLSILWQVAPEGGGGRRALCSKAHLSEPQKRAREAPVLKAWFAFFLFVLLLPVKNTEPDQDTGDPLVPSPSAWAWVTGPLTTGLLFCPGSSPLLSSLLHLSRGHPLMFQAPMLPWVTLKQTFPDFPGQMGSTCSPPPHFPVVPVRALRIKDSCCLEM